MRQKFDSKTSLSGEDSYEDYLKSIPKRDKAILFTILSKLQLEGKEALKYLRVDYLKDGKINIQKSRWRILGHISGNEFKLEAVEDICCK
ncbi:MAG: hypothetical protein HFE90_11505 [Firmicutes bacterium]|nr:hypothetical protein [Bacillota bacterium]